MRRLGGEPNFRWVPRYAWFLFGVCCCIGVLLVGSWVIISRSGLLYAYSPELSNIMGVGIGTAVLLATTVYFMRFLFWHFAMIGSESTCATVNLSFWDRRHSPYRNLDCSAMGHYGRRDRRDCYQCDHHWPCANDDALLSEAPSSISGIDDAKSPAANTGTSMTGRVTIYGDRVEKTSDIDPTIMAEKYSAVHKVSKACGFVAPCVLGIDSHSNTVCIERIQGMQSVRELYLNFQRNKTPNSVTDPNFFRIGRVLARLH